MPFDTARTNLDSNMNTDRNLIADEEQPQKKSNKHGGEKELTMKDIRRENEKKLKMLSGKTKKISKIPSSFSSQSLQSDESKMKLENVNKVGSMRNIS